MKRILTFNVGSSSVKWQILEDLKPVDSGYVERVTSQKKRKQVIEHVFKKVKDVDAISHRIVHGGSITKPKKVTASLVKQLKKIAELAPLHNIPEIEVIEQCLKHTKKPQIAVFDTAFHQSMPDKAAAYGLPYKYYQKGIRRYGFHGISHEYISRGLSGKVITCHLGSGCSVTAINDGKSIDTSMGFTPLEGVIMGTRSGSLDPAIIPYLMHHEKLSIEKIRHMLQFESGWYGVSGVSKDFRDLLKNKSKRSKLAVDMFVYQIAKQIGAYVAALNGCDTLVFAAGITERNPLVRRKILNQLTYLGIDIDANKNRRNAFCISTEHSKIRVLVIHTNEEQAMAKKVYKVLQWKEPQR